MLPAYTATEATTQHRRCAVETACERGGNPNSVVDDWRWDATAVTIARPGSVRNCMGGVSPVAARCWC